MEFKYESVGDGQCRLTESCNNAMTEHCDVCMFNTGATPRDFYDGELTVEELDEYIES